ncbi:MAG: hypothetical protein AB7P99_06710 [Vicinamibacterales bacterium]
MTWKSTAIVSGAGILATWLASYPPAPGPAPAATPAVPVATTGAEIQHEAARLQQKVRGVIEYEPPTRNPFRFNARVEREVTARSTAIEFAPVVERPAAPPVTFTGVAIETVDGQQVRTAILGTPGGLVFAKVGDEVAGYRVSAIADDAVQLTAVDGSTLTVR